MRDLVRALSPICRAVLIAAVLLLAAASVWSQTAPTPAPHADQPVSEPATLILWNRPIVVFRIPVGSVSPAERAAGAARRFDALTDDVRPDEIAAVPAAIGELRGLLVRARQTVLFGIAEGDLDPTTGESLADVGQRAVSQVRAVMEARAEQERPTVLLRGFGLSLGAGALLVLLLWLIWRAADRALLRIADATHRRAVSLVGVDLRRPIHALERGLVRVAAWGLGAVAAYLWLAYALSQFPYTRPWSERLRAELLAMLRELGASTLQAIPGLFAVLIVFFGARFAIRILDIFFRAVQQDVVKLRALTPDTVGATRRIAAILIWIFALTIAYQYIPGSQTDAFRAIGVLLGLMISLGSAGLVNQLMSGLVVIYSRALRPGEFVRAGDLIGRVTEVGLLSTKLVAKGEEITIPNAVLVSTTVSNFSRLAGDDGPIISTSVGIGYDAPWRQVHAMLLLAAERTPGIRSQPAPRVLQRALSDFVVQYELRGHLESSVDPGMVLSVLHTQIQDAFNEFGVQIMSPAFESQPERPVVVPKSRWYADPAVPPKEGAPLPAARPAGPGGAERA
jgi:small-conductance mechanosensitive channel